MRAISSLFRGARNIFGSTANVIEEGAGIALTAGVLSSVAGAANPDKTKKRQMTAGLAL